MIQRFSSIVLCMACVCSAALAGPTSKIANSRAAAIQPGTPAFEHQLAASPALVILAEKLTATQWVYLESLGFPSDAKHLNVATQVSKATLDKGSVRYGAHRPGHAFFQPIASARKLEPWTLGPSETRGHRKGQIPAVASTPAAKMSTLRVFSRTRRVTRQWPAVSRQRSFLLKLTVKADGLSLTFDYPSTMISGKENVVVLIVRNEGDRPIWYYDNSVLKSASFDATRDGQPVPSTSAYKAWTEVDAQSKSPKPALLAKGEELRIVLNFTRLMDLSVPGEYEITAAWGGAFADTYKGVVAKVGPAKVRVIEAAPATPQ